MSNRVRIVAQLALCDIVMNGSSAFVWFWRWAAVIAPLMFLMGLKHGTIATLRHKLVQDPVYREIRPAQTREYPAQWFHELLLGPKSVF